MPLRWSQRSIIIKMIITTKMLDAETQTRLMTFAFVTGQINGGRYALKSGEGNAVFKPDEWKQTNDDGTPWMNQQYGGKVLVNCPCCGSDSLHFLNADVLDKQSFKMTLKSGKEFVSHRLRVSINPVDVSKQMKDFGSNAVADEQSIEKIGDPKKPVGKSPIASEDKVLDQSLPNEEDVTGQKGKK